MKSEVVRLVSNSRAVRFRASGRLVRAQFRLEFRSTSKTRPQPPHRPVASSRHRGPENYSLRNRALTLSGTVQQTWYSSLPRRQPYLDNKALDVAPTQPGIPKSRQLTITSQAPKRTHARFTCILNPRTIPHSRILNKSTALSSPQLAQSHLTKF